MSPQISAAQKEALLSLEQVRHATELEQLLAQTPTLLDTSMEQWLTEQAVAANKDGDWSGRIRWLAYRDILAQYRRRGPEMLAPFRQAPPVPSDYDFALLASPLAQLLLYGAAETPVLQVQLAEAALRTIRPNQERDLWGVLHCARAEALLQQHGQNRQDHLETARQSLQEALQAWKDLPSITQQQRAIALQGLATVYRHRAAGARRENLKQALGYYQLALSTCPPAVDARLWADVQVGRAAVLLEMPAADHGSRQEAITAYQAALAVYAPEKDKTRWTETVVNLATAYEAYPVAANLEKTQQLATAVLKQLSPLLLPWARSHVILGNVFVYEPSGNRLENLAAAVDHYQKALAVLDSSVHALDWARAHTNLASAHRHYPVQRREHLQQAVGHYKEALTVFTKADYPYEWAQVQMGLGDVFSQPAFPDRAESLEKATRAYNKALKLLNQDDAPVVWATLQNNLGNAYADRMAGEREQNQRDAIDCYKRALLIRTEEKMPARWAETRNNLGTVYSEATFMKRETRVAKAIRCLEDALKVHTASEFPADARRAAWNLAQIRFAQREWPAAAAAAAEAVAAAENLYEAGGITTSRQLELTGMGDLTAIQAYSLAQDNQLPAAVEALERGRARALREALSRRDASLERLTPENQQTFTLLQKRIAELEAEARAIDGTTDRTFVDTAAALRQVRQQLTNLVENIRRDDPDFMPTGLNFPGIASVARTVQQPLVYLCTTLYGSLALIMLPQSSADTSKEAGVLPVWLEEFKEANLQRILYDSGNRHHYLHSIVLGQQDMLQEVLDDAWPLLQAALLDPVVRQLQERGYQTATLIATGMLSLLPLPALTIDNMTFTLNPSARALQSALARAREKASDKRILTGIGNPLPSPAPLPFARVELEEVAASFGGGEKRLLYEYEATGRALAQALPGSTYLHLACHGTFNVAHPLDSALYLAGDETISLRDILDGRLDLSTVGLAVLSACQTGIPDFQRVPDEAIGFPAGFLQTGMASVISTLWPVSDESTMLLMARFYELHLLDGVTPVTALRQAQVWLRNLTNEAVVELLEEHMGKAIEGPGMSDEVVADMYRRFVHQEEWDERPFAHPYYWAAFTFTGFSRWGGQ